MFNILIILYHFNMLIGMAMSSQSKYLQDYVITDCMEMDTDYFLSDIVPIDQAPRAGSWQECSEICRTKYEECKFWTLIVGICLVKTSKDGKRNKQGAISGSRECGSNPGEFGEKIRNCMEMDTDYFLSDIVPFDQAPRGGSWQECSELCRNKYAECKFWTLIVGKCLVKTSKDGKRNKQGAISGSRECGSNTEESGQHCEKATRRDVLGPFYEENGLTSYDIAPPYELNKDDQLVVEGQVMDSRCRPIQGATVEVWYAGGGKPEGCDCIDYVSGAGFGNCGKLSQALGGFMCYVQIPSTCTDRLKSQSDEGLFKSARACNSRNPDYKFPPATLWYRGKMTTNENGEYSYRGTFPAVYPQRPIRHIHYKVTDNNRGVELVTQLYFRDFVPPSFEDYVRGRDTQFPKEFLRQEVGSKIVFNVLME